MAQTPNIKVLNRWVARFIPFILICVVGYATYVTVALLSVNYLLNHKKRQGIAITLLVIYFVLFLLMSLTYARLLYIVNWDPGYVPLGRGALSRKGKRPGSNHSGSRTGEGIETTSYESNQEPTNPDCPGLENFYTKDVFACETDGRPRWCTECENWKPERSHHCREVGRCVRKMDHFCPWVGGVVGENSFNFFIQFVTYTALYCTFVLVVMAVYIHEVRMSPEPADRINPQWAVTLGIAAFFGLFTFSMAVTSIRFALTNLSSIEVLSYKTQVKRFAIFISRTASDSAPYAQVIYPVPIIPKVSGSASSIREATDPAIPQQQARDSQAVRVFALVTTKPGDNPYDIGFFANWKDVMGEMVFDWFLPMRRSPCCRHEHDESEYKLGDAIKRARERNGLPSSGEGYNEKRVEMTMVSPDHTVIQTTMPAPLSA